MKLSEIKDLIIGSLDSDTENRDVSTKLEREGVIYDFRRGFNDAVIDKLFPLAYKVKEEIEFIKSMNFAFRSIAISGVAAIIVLMVSIFIMEGSLSVDSFLGLKDNYDESIICLLTGK
jgi:hypothetical protein